MAPSDPQEHLLLAKEVFPYAKGKRIYIDKTFSPNRLEAEEIFALAKQYGISFFSTSALRYAKEIEHVKAAESIEMFGGGRTFEEYIIHQVEMLVKTMGVDLKTAQVIHKDDVDHCTVTFKDGRVGKLNFCPRFDFSFQANGVKTMITSDYFGVLIEKILSFFETGMIDFDPSETLAAMSLREALIESKSHNGEIVTIQ